MAQRKADNPEPATTETQTQARISDEQLLDIYKEVQVNGGGHEEIAKRTGLAKNYVQQRITNLRTKLRVKHNVILPHLKRTRRGKDMQAVASYVQKLFPESQPKSE